MIFLQFKISFETILHLACKSNKLNFVKYIISLKKIDVTQRNVLFNFSNKISMLTEIHSISFIMNIHNVCKYSLFLKQFYILLANQVMLILSNILFH